MRTRKLHVYYDPEGDFLELQVGAYTDGYFKNLGKGVFQRVDRKTNKVVGLAVADFLKRTAKRHGVAIPLPKELGIPSN